MAQGRDSATLAELRLHRRNSGERGPGRLEGLGANRGVFRAIDGEAELTEAKDGCGATVITEWTAADGERWRSSLVARAERE